MPKSFYLVLFLSVSGLAHAEKWVGISVADHGESMYADTESVIRNGELASISVKVNGVINAPPRITYEFDCVKKTMVSYKGTMVSVYEPQKGAFNDAMPKLYEIACRQSWKFWR